MPAPRRDDVQKLLAERETTISGVVLGAWKRLSENPERLTFYRRTRATLIHNYMMNAAPLAFAGDAGVRPIEKQETIYFVVDQRLIFRFKKGDAVGLSSNIETQAALAFNDPQQTFPELPDVGRVDIAYVLNPFETLIDRILVVARNASRLAWSYPIYPRMEIVEAPPTLPVQPIPPAPARTVVRLPPAANRKEEESS